MIKITVSKKGVQKLEADQEQLNNAVERYYLHPSFANNVEPASQRIV